MADFQWPEVTDQQLRELLYGRCTITIEDMRDAIHLARRLDAAHHEQIMQAWKHSCMRVSVTLTQWLLTRGATVEPLLTAAPTLAEALEASKLLAGESAGVVIRYLQAQQQQHGQEGQE